MQTVALRCRCGAVRGVAERISPGSNTRAVCYCDDCQIFALHLGLPDVLDAQGGTDACLLAPAQVKIHQGSDQLRCLRLSPNGMHRWYAGCCNTPIGNTGGPRLPVVLLVHSCMDHAADGRTRDEDVGAPFVRMQARFAAGGVPPGAHAKTPFRMLPHVASHLLRGWLGGRAQPSPFFDAHGRPRVAPQLLDRAERDALRAQVIARARAQGTA